MIRLDVEIGRAISHLADISQLEMEATEEEGETKMVVKINRSKGETLCSYNRKEI